MSDIIIDIEEPIYINLDLTPANFVQGPQGPTGVTGPQGIQGPQGEKGDDGGNYLLNENIPFGSIDNELYSSSILKFIESTRILQQQKQNRNNSPFTKIIWDQNPNTSNWSLGLEYNMENFCYPSNEEPYGNFANWGEYLSYGKDLNLPTEMGGNLIKNRGFNILNENPLRPMVYESIEQCWIQPGNTIPWWEWHIESRATTGVNNRPMSFAGAYDGSYYGLSLQVHDFNIYKPKINTSDPHLSYEEHKYSQGLKYFGHKNHIRLQSTETNYPLYEKFRTDGLTYFNVLGFKNNVVTIGDFEGVEVQNMKFNTTYGEPNITSQQKILNFDDIKIDIYSSEGNGRYMSFKNEDNSKRINWNYNGNHLWFESENNNRPIIISTNAPTYALAIGANGHIVLGGNSDGNPYDRLEVGGNARISGYIQFSATKDHTAENVLNGSIFRNPDGGLYYKGDSGTITKLANA